MSKDAFRQQQAYIQEVEEKDDLKGFKVRSMVVDDPVDASKPGKEKIKKWYQQVPMRCKKCGRPLHQDKNRVVGHIHHKNGEKPIIRNTCQCGHINRV